MNRLKAVTFKLNCAYSELPCYLLAILDACDKEEVQHAEPCPQLDYSTLWITNNKFQELCSNSVFWGAMCDDIIISTNNFRVKVSVSEDFAGFQNPSNDNQRYYINANNSNDIKVGEYLSNDEYRSQFILTSDFIDSIADIKNWIMERGIKKPGTFNFNKTEQNLKLEVKEYYNLLEDYNEETI